jgi:hypothetical protein
MSRLIAIALVGDSVIHIGALSCGLPRGSVQDQAALHGLLGAIRDVGLSIVAAETVAVAGAPALPESKDR